MARLTERVRLTVPAEVKADWKRRAAAHGLSLGAFLRTATEHVERTKAADR